MNLCKWLVAKRNFLNNAQNCEISEDQPASSRFKDSVVCVQSDKNFELQVYITIGENF